MKISRIDADVLGVLERAAINGRTVQLIEQIDRDLYVRTNKVLEALGGKWTRKIKAHLFNEDAETRVGEAISTASFVRPQDIGFYETPEWLADEAAQWANIEPHMSCLEPSAGRGRILRALEKWVNRQSISAIERDGENAGILFKEGWLVDQGDFMAMGFNKRWDRVVMNPPFANQQDIDHVMKAYGDCLKVGGVLVSIMSASVTFRSNGKTQAFRELVLRHGELRELPSDAFKESGAGVRAVMVRIVKPEE